MSREEAKRFIRDFAGKDSENARELEGFIAEQTSKGAAEAAVEFAAARGYEFTAEEFKDATVDERELDDEELDSISGGYENCDNEVNSCYVFWTACDTNYKCFSASGAS